MHFSAFWIYHNYGVVRVTIMITPLRDLLVLNDTHNGTFVIILTVIMSVVMVNFFIYFQSYQNDRHSHWYYKTTVNIILVRNHYKVSEVSLSEVIFS